VILIAITMVIVVDRFRLDLDTFFFFLPVTQSLW